MSTPYVPPHLRNRQHQPSSPSPPFTSCPAQSSTTSLAPIPSSASSSRNGHSQSRTPWTRAPIASASTARATTDNWPSYDQRSPVATRIASNPPSRSRPAAVAGSSAAGPSRLGTSGSPSLYIYGDSFVGPMKLLSEQDVRVQTFKGASAKGLNNPNSTKQVAATLTPALNELLAPPPYRYVPSSGRYAMLVFGNVDLQINYLWQLQNKVLSELSFPPNIQAKASSPLYQKAEIEGEDTDADSDDNHTADDSSSNGILARATETSLTGPALGPELFIAAVLKSYTGWLEREIINGPIGQRLRESADKRRRVESGEEKGRLPPPGRIFVAAALPPLVEDETLHQIPEKYVERLEEDHEKAEKALRASSSAAWRERRGSSESIGARSEGSTRDIEVGLSTVRISDNPPLTPPSGNSSTSSRRSDDTNRTPSPVRSTSTGATTPPSSAFKPSHRQPSPTRSKKTSIATLLAHDPPLCTLHVRIWMTREYNKRLEAFCALYPDVLQFVDITSRMISIDKAAGYDGAVTSPHIRAPSPQPVHKQQASVTKKADRKVQTSGRRMPSQEKDVPGETAELAATEIRVDRLTWACPIDPTNVHPLWEPTLPLWLDVLGQHGVQTAQFKMVEGAEETFRAYEADKRRRTREKAERLRLEDLAKAQAEADALA